MSRFSSFILYQVTPFIPRLLGLLILMGPIAVASGNDEHTKIFAVNPIENAGIQVSSQNVVPNRVYHYVSPVTKLGTLCLSTDSLDEFPGEPYVWKLIRSSANYKELSPSARMFKTESEVYLPWFQIGAGSRLLGARFGLEGDQAKQMFRLSLKETPTNDSTVGGKPGPKSVFSTWEIDTESDTEVLRTIRGEFDSVFAWIWDVKTGKWVVLPRRILNPLTGAYRIEERTELNAVYQVFYPQKSVWFDVVTFEDSQGKPQIEIFDVDTHLDARFFPSFVSVHGTEQRLVLRKAMSPSGPVASWDTEPKKAVNVVTGFRPGNGRSRHEFSLNKSRSTLANDFTHVLTSNRILMPFAVHHESENEDPIDPPSITGEQQLEAIYRDSLSPAEVDSIRGLLRLFGGGGR